VNAKQKISQDGQRVWLIDFEAGVILPEEGKDRAIRGEIVGLDRMFEDLSTGNTVNTSFSIDSIASLCCGEPPVMAVYICSGTEGFPRVN
jgi:hypothetical protein